MRLKRAVIIIGTLLILLVIFMIYSTKDLTAFSNKSISEELHDNKWLHFEDRIKQLENDLNKHHQAIGQIRVAVNQMISPTSSTPIKNQTAILKPGIPSEQPAFDMIFKETCGVSFDRNPKTDVQMLDTYKKLKFDNPDGGVWKQGWKIEVDQYSWNKQHKLKVFVVPHSHNDPGWIKTFEEYYAAQTRNILDNMVDKLAEDPRRKFIWAEVSYFALWWNDVSEEKRKEVFKLLKNNQLEIVTGGWVMNDEANSHWISIIHQMTEGHQWLQTNLNYTPQSHWSIDPFGMSSTQAVLLNGIGLKNMLIQRVHYSIKKELASSKRLEFRWRQLWDNLGTTDVLTQLMPFYSYDIPHTCGPDPKICCQFDFRRLPGHGLHCPWRIAPQPITDVNLVSRAELLLDQYRKKSQLYQTNVLLVPLGDDFRYDHSSEWDAQYDNYQKLFDYMNGNLKLHVHAQFGTLTDYFQALEAEKPISQFPTLSGDFFTYADRDDHYWSGYYTSRPFYKRMDRILLSYIRAAEVILTLAKVSNKQGSTWIANDKVGYVSVLQEARQALALFQHHDGITGTAKDHVVKDYGKKMLAAISTSQSILQHCTHLLLDGMGADVYGGNNVFYNVDDIRQNHDSIPERYTITIGPELNTKKVVIFNSLTFSRMEVVTFHVSTPFIEVLDFKGQRITCQIAPIFEHGAAMSLSKYRLSFVATIPAFGLVTYIIKALEEDETPNETVFSDVKIFNQYADVQTPRGFPNIDVSVTSNEFTLKNARISAAFNELGLLKAIKIGTTTIPVHLDFAKYGVRHTVERSGGYLFLPDGDAVTVQIVNTIVKIVEGPIYSAVMVQLPFVHHTVTLYNTPGADSLGIEIENLVDILATSNFELAMRLSTNINSTEDFFTDLNGFQVVRRKRFKKLPLQANYYPMPTMIYIEDDVTRLTALTASPLGCSSLRQGQIEVMLDRRLNQDDNLGMGQGVLDNLVTKHVFRVILERKTHNCKGVSEGHPSGIPSISAHVASQTLLNPLVQLLRTDDEDMSSKTAYVSVIHEFGVDISVPILRPSVYVNDKEYIGLVVHRMFLDVCYADRVLLEQFPLSHGEVNLTALLPTEDKSKLYKSSLSFLKLSETLNIKENIPICPMSANAYVISR